MKLIQMILKWKFPDFTVNLFTHCVHDTASACTGLTLVLKKSAVKKLPTKILFFSIIVKFANLVNQIINNIEF